ncbi:MAG TPA: sigma-54-dependent Fis family transcriptional regulator [Clostridia bacterium]|nr:sigma-54-dependent Fis family transcriptional regulator [Clostridia bacterium]
MTQRENTGSSIIGLITSSVEVANMFRAAAALYGVRPVYRIVPEESSLKALRSLEEEGAQAVIASPGFLRPLRDNSSVPIVGYFVSRYDVLLSLKAASAEAASLGLLYFGDQVFDEDLLKRVACKDVYCLNPRKNREEVISALKEAKEKGIETILCGQNVVSLVREAGLTPFAIKPGMDSMMLAVSAAIGSADAAKGLSARIEKFREALVSLSEQPGHKTRGKKWWISASGWVGTLGDVKAARARQSGTEDGPNVDRGGSLSEEALDRATTSGEAPGEGGERLETDYAATSDAMILVLTEARACAKDDKPVLITGEVGTGKHYLATRIHQASRRSKGPLISVHAKGIPEEALDVELFGCDGGPSPQVGVFEMAHGGTVVLVEIGHFPLRIQAKILSLIKNRVIVRCGQSRAVPVDVRIVATTSQDLKFMSRMRRFNRELYVELEAHKINLLPLRNRPGDIIPLFCAFVREIMLKESPSDSKPNLTAMLDLLGTIIGGGVPGISAGQGGTSKESSTTMAEIPVPAGEGRIAQALQKYDWPGNLKELKALARKYVSLVGALPAVSKEYIEEAILGELQMKDEVPGEKTEDEVVLRRRSGSDWHDLKDFCIRVQPGELDFMIDQIISQLLPVVNGNRSELSRRLGISRTTLWKKLSKTRSQGS